MKKFLFAVLFVLIFGMIQLYAQNTSERPNLYYTTVQLNRIWIHRDGYMVLYQRGFNTVRTFIPFEWFAAPAARADLITLPTGTTWPYLTIFYEGGIFSHLKLYVRRDRSHQTWGVVPQHVNIDQFFMNFEEVPLEL